MITYHMHNKLDKNSSIPLYMQLKQVIISDLEKGVLIPGCIMKTEHDICETYGISRYPVRQALKELESEGILTRTRGKGTFVNKELPLTKIKQKDKTLGLILGNLRAEFEADILSGFERQARKKGYQTNISATDWSPSVELECIEMMLNSNIFSVTLFPSEDSLLPQELESLKNRGLHISLLDRNCGIEELDYIGSDNLGGAYSAVRHLAMKGFQNVACVSMIEDVSSINERIEGYLKAVDDYDLNALTHINIEENLNKYPYSTRRFFVEKLRDELLEQKGSFPAGIFAVNDSAALQCLNILTQEGYVIGKDVGIVGFDNAVHSEYSNTPLTSVAQNGLLIGSKAADIAIDKIEGKTTQIFKIHLPTQLIIRKSCGE